MKLDSGLLAILTGTVATATLVQTLPARALTGQEVNNIAREVTVLIIANPDEPNESQGSGVIISRDGDTYYVLTAAHVINNREDADGDIEYVSIAHDHKPYEIDYDTVEHLPGSLDLAIFEFESDEDYPVATLADSDLVTEGTPVFVSGWPRPGAVSNVSGQQRIRHFVDGRVSTVLNSDFSGYQLGYTNNTLGGMSGGPVVDAGGRVVAIHGSADLATVSSIPGLESASASEQQALREVMLGTGFNFGIPINTFVENAANFDLDLNTDSAPPPELGAPYVASATPDERDVINDLDSVLDTLETIERGIRIIESIF